MMAPRSSEHPTKIHQQEKYDAAAGMKGAEAAAMAGRTAYREEFQRDHGPDLDESLDKMESGREF